MIDGLVDTANLAKAFGLVLAPKTLAIIFLASFYGLFFGAIPGLTATMATALLVPVTFFMDPVPAIGAIIAATAMAIFSGDVPGVLLRIPGTPASAAYTDEAYAMTLKGQSELALGACLVFSVIGGLFGSLALALVAPALAEFALKFSTFEYFWLACLGLTCAVFVSRGDPLKGIISLCFGLGIAQMGIDVVHGTPRFTFGNINLMGGVDLVPALVGFFAVPELIRNVTANHGRVEIVAQKIGSVFRGQWELFKRYPLNTFRGNVIGVLIGALPGAGADIAAWISYAVSKKFSKEKEKFGTGHPEGLVDAGAANNSALGGAWVPALVFGIPGDSITAIVIGVLYMKGMQPGPTVFINSQDLVYALFIVFFLANLLMIPFGWAMIKASRRILSVPREVLMPVILLFCVVGSFAIENSLFNVWVMLVMGIIGYLFEENGIPTAPAILGLVLGKMIEENFLLSMIKVGGDVTGLFARPIGGTLGALTIAIWVLPLAWLAWRRVSAGRAA
ncbi:MAG: tripartite tricarboxylate transporter permease [Alphaproteobacteria bacterium]|jgi:TctA family transporter